jgi:uncharacterized protein YeaO (DUF488 family)
VDRLWPRGLSKDKAKVNLWLREVAPSDELRKWFSHDVKKWEDFRERYKSELRDKLLLLHKIKQLERENGAVTLIYSAKNETDNNAVVLKDILQTL